MAAREGPSRRTAGLLTNAYGHLTIDSLTPRSELLRGGQALGHISFTTVLGRGRNLLWDMGVTRSESEGQAAREPVAALGPSDTQEHPANSMIAPPVPVGNPEAPTSQLLAGSVGERCANCGAPLATDQRYCVQCGERRGASRFSPASMAAPATTVTTTTGPPPESRRSRYGATLIAGIATLLLAMGVGVLIGKAGNNNNNNSAAKSPEVITVNGGGAAGTSTGSTGAKVTRTSSGSTHHAGSKASHPPKTEAAKAKQAANASKPTTAAVNKASHAASSVLGGGASQQNNTVTTGAACTAGSAGCTNGHFSGTFFGGG
jgi:hypothetical protein